MKTAIVHLYQNHKPYGQITMACGKRFHDDNPNLDYTIMPGFVTCKNCEKTESMKRNMLLMDSNRKGN
jgi:predicted alternative tryptophan synthase beta-subunit